MIVGRTGGRHLSRALALDGTVSPLSVHLGLGRLQYCTSQQDSDPQGEIPASSITAGEPNTAPDIQQLQPDPVAAEAREFIHTQSRHRKWRDRPPGHQQDQDRAPDTNANEFGTKAGPNRYLGKAPLIAWPARITGVGRRTTARDILRALAGFDLQEGQVRAQLNEHFVPTAFWVDFQTHRQQQLAERCSPFMVGPRKLFVHASTLQQWKKGTYHPFANKSYDKFVLVTGIQENATMTDIARHFQGYGCMPNAVTFLRQQPKNRLDTDHPSEILRARHRAIVRFVSAEEAARAVRDLSGSFLLNNLLRLRTFP